MKSSYLDEPNTAKQKREEQIKELEKLLKQQRDEGDQRKD